MDEGTREPRVGYRTDIQGLRAVAIVLVVVCHTGLALPGGFVGVDVFFVVSGFVMGRLLTRELDDEGTLSFGGFYARRARRLLLSLAVAVCRAREKSRSRIRGFCFSTNFPNLTDAFSKPCANPWKAAAYTSRGRHARPSFQRSFNSSRR